MQHFVRKFRWAIPVLREVAIVAVAALAVHTLYNMYWNRSESRGVPTANAMADLAIGKEVHLARASLTGPQVSVLLVTSPTCVHCKASGAFHRQLLDRCRKLEVPAYVLVPDIRAARDYLKEFSLDRGEVRTWRDLSAAVHATPTLILTDSSGGVRRVFVGELSAERQAETLSLLADPSGLSHIPPQTISGQRNYTDSEYSKLAGQPHVVLLDVRERQLFQAGHRQQAINIPLEELTVRAAFELASTDLHVIDCSALREITCRWASENLSAQSLRVATLNMGGIAGGPEPANEAGPR